jgi:hypothetical protein
VIRSIEGTLNVQVAEDGRLSFVLFRDLLIDVLLKDLGKLGAPPLVEFLDDKRSLYLAISFDATGFGAAQLTTIAVRNSWLPRSAQHLRVFGPGNCGDDRDGMVRLMGPNLAFINEIFHAKRAGHVVSIALDNDRVVKLDIDLKVVLDVAALRHFEHMLNAGWCCCPREQALRTIPKKPETVAEMIKLLRTCESATFEKRCLMSHNPLPGSQCLVPAACLVVSLPPIPAPPQLSTRRCSRTRLNPRSKAQAAVDKKARTAWSKRRCDAARTHDNVPPGAYGRPLLEHDMKDQILDALHLGLLNMPKIAWKYAILNNCSDHARELIDAYLKTIKHPLDTRRKDNN